MNSELLETILKEQNVVLYVGRQWFHWVSLVCLGTYIISTKAQVMLVCLGSFSSQTVNMSKALLTAKAKNGQLGNRILKKPITLELWMLYSWVDFI